jgi:hypothetical protein
MVFTICVKFIILQFMANFNCEIQWTLYYVMYTKSKGNEVVITSLTSKVWALIFADLKCLNDNLLSHNAEQNNIT